MRKKVIKFLLFTTLFIVVLVVIAFLVVYQEFGPVNDQQLIEHKVRQSDLVANFIYLKGHKKMPIIIAVGGSGGGFLPDREMKSLALNGYAVLSVAYFNQEGLPRKLEEIPLEYFGNAINWISQQPTIDTSKIVMLGVSRGAELALLLASIYPQIKGVITYAPGCFILPNAVDTEDSIATHSSWTWKGNPLPFAPLKVLQDDSKEIISYRYYIQPLLKEPDKENYLIKVENIRGPILFLSGEEDQTWPAAEMSSLLEQRLKDNQYSYPVRNIIFPNAGHWLLQFEDNYQVVSSTFFRIVSLNLKGKKYQFNNGGSAWATMTARRKAREETLRFLEQYE